jgi:cytochrome c-type biogenesis protein CcmH/NrfG
MLSSRDTGRYLSAFRISGLALSLSILVALAQQPTLPAAANTATAGNARAAAQRCRAHPAVGSCDDALRWNPSDASLLAAMGDALMRERRSADALRAYQRAAALAPDTPGLQKKIKTAQGAKKAVADASSSAPQAKRFSNSDPDTQTH